MQALGNHFYEVVPPSYATYCSFTSRISKAVLEHFGLACQLVPCQIWYCKPDHTYVIGFLGQSKPNKWDGHVVCRADNWIVDAAIHHFSKEFGLSVPKVVSTTCFEFPTQPLATWQISSTDSVWWQQPPNGVDTTPPEEPADMVAGYATELIKRVTLTLGTSA